MAYFAPYIDGKGLHMPTYEDLLNDLLTNYKSIFGADAVMSASVPDYQLLSLFSKALDDTTMLTLQAYMARNPAYATGQNLDDLMSMYGIERQANESDASLRRRASNSLVSSRGKIYAGRIADEVKKCLYVKDAMVYENATDTTDDKGIPAHSIATVIYAGNGPAVAQCIYENKAPGIATYGNSHEDILDEDGNTQSIYFTRTSTRRVFVYVVVRRLPGCDDIAVTNAIKSLVTSFINEKLMIGKSLIIPQLYGVAYGVGSELFQTFAISDIYANLQGESTYTRDEITCPWDAKISTLANGGVTVTLQN